MTRLAYGLPSAIGSAENLAYPGMGLYAEIFKLYGKWVIPVDRTGTITMPVQDVSHFPLPPFRPFTKSFEELCDERALKILHDTEQLGLTVYVLYSGGIDSTCLLVSMLKHATAEQKKNIIVLLSHESITENPRFYEEHIRGKLRVGSSISFPELIGENVCLLSAEHNDMVMGSERIGKLMVKFGPGSIYKPYDRDMLTEFFAGSFGSTKVASFYLDIFERIRDAAPIPIISNMDFLWWVNFAIKWQACYYYILLFTPPRNADKIDRAYLDTRFISFYNTEEFQLWSMNNLDKRIKDTWPSYKWVVKDIIYDYNKDAEYRDHKLKKGSLLPLLGFNPPVRFIDEDLHLSSALEPDMYMQERNDFA